MTEENEGLQHVSTFMENAHLKQQRAAVDAYLTSGRCINDPPPRAPEYVLRVVETPAATTHEEF